MRARGAIAALAALLIAADTGAIDYCVNAATGSDANTGACPGQAWATLGPAQSFTFAAGDRVLIAAGQYTFPLTAWYMKPRVSWIGSGRGVTTVIFNRPSTVPFVRFRTGTNGSGSPTDLRPENFGPDTVFSDMTLVNQGQATTGVDLATTDGDCAPTLRNLEIVGFPTGIGMRPSSDERVAASTHALITQSVIRGSSTSGLLFSANVLYPRVVLDGSTVENTMASAGVNGAFLQALINDTRDERTGRMKRHAIVVGAGGALRGRGVARCGET